MKKNYSTFQGITLLFFSLLFLTSSFRAQVVQTFSYTGGVQTYSIVSCISTVTLEVWGAQGGANWISNDNYGGYASAVFSLSAGDVLSVYVGEQPNGTTGGFNGGGNGESAGQGGGGGTDFRLNGTALSNRIIVAGGGGGAGYWSNLHVVGGQGGGLAGTDGYRMPSDAGGQGGTQNGSGNGTCSTLNNPAMTGGLGYGGAPSGCGCEGYGGGGGYYGGAGSGNCRGGGGGSGYIISTATNGTFTTGARVGHGQARLSYFTNGSAVTVSSPNPFGICPGGTTTLSISGVTTHTWNGGSNAPSIVVSPVNTTTYGVSGTNTLGCVSSTVWTVIVNPLPTLSLTATNTFVCAGQTTTLNAMGASTYAWASVNGSVGTGSMVAVIPVLNASTYTVTGTSQAGCVNTEMIDVSVDPLTLTTTSNTMICTGKQVVLNVSGGINGTYNWSNNVNSDSSPFPNYTPSPTITTIYSVSATNSNGCVISNTISVQVNPKPLVTASSTKTLVCRNQPQLITASGAGTYSWSTGATTASTTVTPALDILYTYVVTGTDANGCSNTASVSLKAELCTGLTEMHASGPGITIFPNPSSGSFRLEIPAGKANRSIRIYNLSGALIKSVDGVSGSMDMDLMKEPAGIYFVHVSDGAGNDSVTKLIKQ